MLTCACVSVCAVTSLSQSLSDPIDPAPVWTQSVAPARESKVGGSAVVAGNSEETGLRKHNDRKIQQERRVNPDFSCGSSRKRLR